MTATNTTGPPAKNTPDVEDGMLAYFAGDYATAVQVFTELGDAGNAVAQTNLGLMLLNGDGIKQDRVAAVKWLKTATEQGYARAQYQLGLVYGNGIGVAKNYDFAYELFTRAATQNYPHAQYSLGVLCYRGKDNGETQDLVQAYKWFSKAATAKIHCAADIRDEIAKRLTASELAAARQLVRQT